MRIPLAAPDITDAEIEAVVSVLRTPTLSIGPRLAEFEHRFADQVGAAHAVAVSSGTAGLHVSLEACGIGAGDEVITTPFSFIASTNAILYARATPVFVDIDPITLNLDPSRVEDAITPRTRAILPVHVFGRPAPMRDILDIAHRRSLDVIEDACEALGAESDGRPVGAIGRCGVFGFYPNKQITTGEGGMVVTADVDVADACRRLRNHGRDAGASAHVVLGYNYRLSEMACALGVAQLARLDTMLAARASVAARYHERLSPEPDILVPGMEIADGRRSWFVYVIQLSREYDVSDRDGIVDEMVRRGIGCGRYFAPIHMQPYIAAALGCRRGDYPVTEAVSDRTIALPFSSVLKEDAIDEVCDNLLTLVALSKARRLAARR